MWTQQVSTLDIRRNLGGNLLTFQRPNRQFVLL